MMKKYFKYELKKSVWPIIILTLIGALIYIPSLMSANFMPNDNPKLDGITFILCAFCILVPFYELSFQKKKRSIDQYYSLPIKRATLIACKFISGYIKIFVSYTIIFFLGLLVIISKENYFHIVYYFPFFLFSVLIGFSLYAFISFIYSRANTIVDGYIFIHFYCFILFLIVLGLCQLFYDIFGVRIDNFSYIYIPFAPIINLTEFFTSLIRHGAITSSHIYIEWLSHLIWAVIGILSIFGLIYSAKIDKAERAEQISDSYFGYRVLIPLCLILIIYTTHLGIGRDMLSLALFFVAGLVLFIIYRRTFKLPLKYWIIFIGSIVIGLLLVGIL